MITARETKTAKENSHFLQAEKRKYLWKRDADKEIFISGLQMRRGLRGGDVMEVSKQMEKHALVFQVILQSLARDRTVNGA